MDITIRQGEDLAVELLVVDTANNAIDLSTSTKLRLGLLIKDTVVYKYLDATRETAITGYGTITVDTTTTNKVIFNLKRTQTATFPVGELYASVLVEFADATLTDKTYEYTLLLGTVTKAYLAGETL